MARILLLFGLISFASTGCYLGESSVQQSFSEEALSNLVPGKSSAQDVANLLGAPTQVVELGENSALLYEHAVSKNAGVWLLIILLSGSDTQSDRIWVFFNAAGILTHAAASFEADQAHYSMPPVK